MGWPSWGELATLIVPVGGGFAWWMKRQDRVSTLERDNRELKQDMEDATTEADKTRLTHERAISELKAEIAEWRRQVERKEDRIQVLEDRLYGKGGAT